MDIEQTFYALADRHRRFLLDSLARSDGQTLTQLSARLPMSRFGAMKHLRVLEDAGLVMAYKVGREKRHYLNPAPLQDVDGWMAKYRRLWEERLDHLEDYLHEIQEERKERSNDGYYPDKS